MGSEKDRTDDQDASPNGREALLSALLRELRENSVALATFGADQRALKEKVQTLTTMLRTDDPSMSLMTRFSILENDVRELKKAAEKADDKIDKLNDTSQTFIIEDRKDMRESNRQKMQVWIAVITAIVGAAVAIITAVYAHK
jgi:hypothetical protein